MRGRRANIAPEKELGKGKETRAQGLKAARERGVGSGRCQKLLRVKQNEK